MIDYRSKEYIKYKLICIEHNKRMREDEDYRELYELATKQFNEYSHPYGKDGYEDGTAFPIILVKYKKNLTKIIKLIEKEYVLKHSKGGRKPKLTVEDMLQATIKYLTTNRTFADIAKEYGIHESNMYDTILWVIGVLKNYKLLNSDEYEGRIIASVNCKELSELK